MVERIPPDPAELSRQPSESLEHWQERVISLYASVENSFYVRNYINSVSERLPEEFNIERSQIGQRFWAARGAGDEAGVRAAFKDVENLHARELAAKQSSAPALAPADSATAAAFAKAQTAKPLKKEKIQPVLNRTVAPGTAPTVEPASPVAPTEPEPPAAGTVPTEQSVTPAAPKRRLSREDVAQNPQAGLAPGEAKGERTTKAYRDTRAQFDQLKEKLGGKKKDAVAALDRAIENLKNHADDADFHGVWAGMDEIREELQGKKKPKGRDAATPDAAPAPTAAVEPVVLVTPEPLTPVVPIEAAPVDPRTDVASWYALGQGAPDDSAKWDAQGKALNKAKAKIQAAIKAKYGDNPPASVSEMYEKFVDNAENAVATDNDAFNPEFQALQDFYVELASQVPVSGGIGAPPTGAPQAGEKKPENPWKLGGAKRTELVRELSRLYPDNDSPASVAANTKLFELIKKQKENFEAGHADAQTATDLDIEMLMESERQAAATRNPSAASPSPANAAPLSGERKPENPWGLDGKERRALYTELENLYPHPNGPGFSPHVPNETFFEYNELVHKQMLNFASGDLAAEEATKAEIDAFMARERAAAAVRNSSARLPDLPSGPKDIPLPPDRSAGERKSPWLEIDAFLERERAAVARIPRPPAATPAPDNYLTAARRAARVAVEGADKTSDPLASNNSDTTPKESKTLLRRLIEKAKENATGAHEWGSEQFRKADEYLSSRDGALGAGIQIAWGAAKGAAAGPAAVLKGMGYLVRHPLKTLGAVGKGFADTGRDIGGLFNKETRENRKSEKARVYSDYLAARVGAQDSKLEKLFFTFNPTRMIEGYRKMPLRYKFAVTGALVAAASFGGAVLSSVAVGGLAGQRLLGAITFGRNQKEKIRSDPRFAGKSELLKNSYVLAYTACYFLATSAATAEAVHLLSGTDATAPHSGSEAPQTGPETPVVTHPDTHTTLNTTTPASPVPAPAPTTTPETTPTTPEGPTTSPDAQPASELPSVNAADHMGHGYESDVRRLYDQMHNPDKPFTLPEGTDPDSDLAKLFNANDHTINTVLRDLAIKHNYLHLNPDGSDGASVAINSNDQFTFDADGSIHVGSHVEAPADAPTTPPLHTQNTSPTSSETPPATGPAVPLQTGAPDTAFHAPTPSPETSPTADDLNAQELARIHAQHPVEAFTQPTTPPAEAPAVHPPSSPSAETPPSDHSGSSDETTPSAPAAPSAEAYGPANPEPRVPGHPEIQPNPFGLRINEAVVGRFTDPGGNQIVYGGPLADRGQEALDWVTKDHAAVVYFDSTKPGFFGLFSKPEISQAFWDPASNSVQIATSEPNIAGEIFNPALSGGHLPSVSDLAHRVPKAP